MAFTGKIYWQAGDLMLYVYDVAAGQQIALTMDDNRIPAPHKGTDFGATFLLPDGTVFVPSRYAGSDGNHQTGFVVDPTLVPTGVTWSIPCNRTFSGGWTGYEDASGIYDSVTGRLWTAYTSANADRPYAWNAFDNNGTWVEGRADITNAGARPDDFWGGSSNWGINASLYDRWLYREGMSGDEIIRYNLDTGQWQAIQPELPSVGGGYGCIFVGIDDTNGNIITVDTSSDTANNAARGLIEVRDPNADAWSDVIPNGNNNNAYRMGEPLARHSLLGPGGPTAAVSTPGYNYVSGSYAISNGYLYYQSTPDRTTYDVDANGNPTGTIFSFYRMLLTDGSIEKVCDVPYAIYNSQSQPCSNNDPNYYADNYTDGLCGMIVIEPPSLEIKGSQLGSRRAFTG